MWLALWLGACAPTTPVPPSHPTELHGARPAAEVVLPEFAAVNERGEARTKADLVGHPTVLWFFPAAGTPG